MSPHRWAVFDTESHRHRMPGGEVQTLQMAVATRWRDDLKRPREPDWLTTGDKLQLWEFIAEWAPKRGRLVVWAHNVAYDLRTSRALESMLDLGWRLDFINLGDSASVVRWRKGESTVVLTDLYSWLPAPLEAIAADLGMTKPPLPASGAPWASVAARCRADVEITAAAARALIAYVRERDLGNFQLSGASQAYSFWRHRHLEYEVLTHTDDDALAAERDAAASGRCEAWRHGEPIPGRWHEWDVELAYCRIAAQCDLPSQIVRTWEPRSWTNYERLGQWYARLCEVEVMTPTPVLAARHDGRWVWPVGTFTTTAWDREIDIARAAGAQLRILRWWLYRRDPILRSWARWTMDALADGEREHPAVALRWIKHQSRALVGRLGVRYLRWDDIGPAYDTDPPLATYLDADTGETGRMLAAGGRLMLGIRRVEGDSSVPQVMSRIMAEQRARLWETIRWVGEDHVAYMDTDSLWVDDAGNERMRALAAVNPALGWRHKQTTDRLTVWGPRAIVVGDLPRVAGIPRTAQRTESRTFTGQVWESLSSSLARGASGEVQVRDRIWTVSGIDHRRVEVDGGWTVPIALDELPPPRSSAARRHRPDRERDALTR